MNVFVIQVSGAENEYDETKEKAKKYWQEPIEQFIYINYDWKDRKSYVKLGQRLKKEIKYL